MRPEDLSEHLRVRVVGDEADGAHAEKHVRSILAKLQLPADEEDHCRVPAVLLFLDAR